MTERARSWLGVLTARGWQSRMLLLIITVLLPLLGLLFQPQSRANVIAAPLADPEVVPLRVVRASGSVIALVGVTVQGQGPYEFVVDTGASRSVVDRQLADDLGLARVVAVPQVTGVSGPAQAIIVRVSEWSTGYIRLPPGPVAAIDLQLSDSAVAQQLLGRRLFGLLGSDVLSSFGSVTIDYAQETLSFGSR